MNCSSKDLSCIFSTEQSGSIKLPITPTSSVLLGIQSHVHSPTQSHKLIYNGKHLKRKNSLIVIPHM